MNGKVVALLFTIAMCFLAFETSANELPEKCTLPFELGLCDAYLVRWGYDASKNECVKFIYGGCKGNENNFVEKEACEAACKV